MQSPLRSQKEIYKSLSLTSGTPGTEASGPRIQRSRPTIYRITHSTRNGIAPSHQAWSPPKNGLLTLAHSLEPSWILLSHGTTAKIAIRIRSEERRVGKER